jgi:hypothetical protein
LIVFTNLTASTNWWRCARTAQSIFAAAVHFLGGPLVISVLSLVILIGWEKLAARGSRFFIALPSALVVVAMEIIVNTPSGNFFTLFCTAVFHESRGGLRTIVSRG